MSFVTTAAKTRRLFCRLEARPFWIVYSGRHSWWGINVRGQGWFHMFDDWLCVHPTQIVVHKIKFHSIGWLTAKGIEWKAADCNRRRKLMYTAVLDTPWTRHNRQPHLSPQTHVNVIARLFLGRIARASIDDDVNKSLEAIYHVSKRNFNQTNAHSVWAWSAACIMYLLRSNNNITSRHES